MVRPRQTRLPVSIRDVASYGKYYFMHDCMFIETKIKKTQDPTGNGKNVSVKKEEVDLDEGNCYYYYYYYKSLNHNVTNMQLLSIKHHIKGI